MRVLVVVAAAIGVGVGAVVWQGSPDSASRQDQLVDAYASGLTGAEISEDQARCWGQAVVEAVGVRGLAEGRTLPATRANPPLVASELGISVSESQGEAFYEALDDCSDPRQLFVPLMGDVDAGCVSQQIDDALLRGLVVAWFTSAPEMSRSLSDGLAGLYESCPAEPGGDQSPPSTANLSTLRNAQTGGSSVTVISYNVRGLLRSTEPTSTVDSDMERFTQVVGDEVARRQADLVLLQENCGAQAELIARRSSERGHAMSVIAVSTDPLTNDQHADAITSCPGGDGALVGEPFPYGRAILAHLPNAVRIEPPPGADPERPPLCIRAQSPRPMRVCNTHTEPPTRAASLLDPFRRWAEAEPLILGGDFNTVETAAPMPTFYSFMHEAATVGCRPPQTLCSPLPTSPAPPIPVNKKIDYIFADDQHFTPPSHPRELLGGVLPMRCTGVGHDPLEHPLGTWCSDHRLVYGEFTLSSAPVLPRQIDPSAQGGSAFAVYLAVTDSYDDPRIADAEAAARSVGYEASASDLGCDVGAAEQLDDGFDDELDEGFDDEEVDDQLDDVDEGVDDELDQGDGEPGQSSPSFPAAVAVYFATEGEAAAAREAFESRGIPVVGVANISFICVDGA